MYLVPQQVTALEIVRKSGYEPYDAIPLTGSSSKYNTDIVAVRATKDGENYLLRVSTYLNKILSNDLVVTRWCLSKDRRDYSYDGWKVFDVKRFSRSIR